MAQKPWFVSRKFWFSLVGIIMATAVAAVGNSLGLGDGAIHDLVLGVIAVTVALVTGHAITDISSLRQIARTEQAREGMDRAMNIAGMLGQALGALQQAQPVDEDGDANDASGDDA